MSETDKTLVWSCQPAAAAYVAGLWEQYTAALPAVRSLEGQARAHASTRLLDWLDHLVLADGPELAVQLAGLGYAVEDVPAGPGETVYHHPGAILPRLVLHPTSGAAPGTVLAAALPVDDIAAFLLAQRAGAPIEGSPLGPYRQARLWPAAGRAFLVVERRATRSMLPVAVPADHAQAVLEARERWAARPRPADDALSAMRQALALARELARSLGTDMAAWAVFSVERTYWRQRNHAGIVQKARQDRLGLGWGNHDHHTFRSSRAAFALLIEILETLGFRPREQFYAGEEAGWGAQVMEQPVCGLAVFADVDLAPDEVGIDFAHAGLSPRKELGTVGLWCALHGESMLAAGLHHLAARLDFAAAADALAPWNVSSMAPFSDFPYLRQSFTQAERWVVEAGRLERLQAAGQISAAQAERFAQEGARGSHLENIQRGEGFKGFNQQRVSDIIRRTDPRAA